MGGFALPLSSPHSLLEQGRAVPGTGGNLAPAALPCSGLLLGCSGSRWGSAAARAHLVPTLPLFPQICHCSIQRKTLPHQCSEAQQFPMLGRLVGHLTLCCTCKNQRTCEKAAQALFHLHKFILVQKRKRNVRLGPSRHGQPGATLLAERKPDQTCLPAA